MTCSTDRGAAFLRRHNMHWDQTPFAELRNRYEEEMDRALRGEPSSLYMLPAYLRSGDRPRRETSVLVIDAGGTNLRAARAHFTRDGQVEVEALKKRRMPGADGQEISAGELFREIAAFALERCRDDCQRACISFSYPCRALPSGDGQILALCKELRVQDAQGVLVCAALEDALCALGAPGRRQWRLINDSVGSLLGGMVQADRSRFADYIGFILGTGTNTCCCVPAAHIVKDPAAVAMGGDMIVNVESGCFDRLLLGTADRRVDQASELPWDHLAEKMISGGYYPLVLRETLLLAAEEGELPPEVAAALRGLRLRSQDVDEFCLAPQGPGRIASLLPSAEARAFAAEVNTLLLERAAQITAGCLCAILHRRELPRGSRVCICADGTTFRRNPLLRPRTEAWLAREAGQGLGVETEFLFVDDATLLGSVWAGLTGEE